MCPLTIYGATLEYTCKDGYHKAYESLRIQCGKGAKFYVFHTQWRTYLPMNEQDTWFAQANNTFSKEEFDAYNAQLASGNTVSVWEGIVRETQAHSGIRII